MDIVDINRIESQSDINTKYNATQQVIEDHLVILDELKQILEFECSKDPLASSNLDRPNAEFIKRVGNVINNSSEILSSIYTT